MNLTIMGQTPSKKNARKPFIRNGRMMNFPSPKYMEWEKDALWQLKGKDKVSTYPVALTMIFHVKDNRGRDLDNMASSVLDMLQKAEIIEGDSWQHVRPITIDCAGVSKDAKVEVYFD